MSKIDRIAKWMRDRTIVVTSAYGTARTVIAVAQLLTLLATPIDTLFRPLAGISAGQLCSTSSPSRWAVFCMPGDLELGRWLAIVLLAIVASGWRPRVTGLLHWWLSWSIFGTLSAGDGGDQAAAMLTLFLVPVTLVDGRRWHWGSPAVSAR